MHRGMTLGKFAPLHKGHQLVIETAIAEMDEVLVIIYDAPETTNIPLQVRAAWLRNLYPAVHVIEAWDGPTDVGNTPEIRKKHEEYILNNLDISEVTHFYSSEFYGEHMSVALHAIDRRVDVDRTHIPISATAIRADPYGHRAYLEPLVYRDLVTNVVLLGAPSTGKTTLAAALAKLYKTQWMPEYGREYWETHQIERRLSLQQLTEIAEGHLIREEQLLQAANRYLFVDTNAIATFVFSRYYHNDADSRLRQLATTAATRYDLVFVCDTDIPYDDTWDRSGDGNRQMFQKRVLADLHERKIPYFLISGNLEQRMARAQDILTRFIKYGNLVALFENGDRP